MPLEGSAIARSYSAEFIHAARVRSQSASSQRDLNGAPTPAPSTYYTPADTYDTSATPNLFTVPSPIYAVPRRNEEFDNQGRARSPPTSPGAIPRRPRGVTATSRRGVQPPAEVIPEEDDPNNGEPLEEEARSSSSDSAQTLANRDVERGDGSQGKKADKQGEKKGEKPAEGGQEAEKKKEKDPFLVTLEGREHINPHTWKESYRWFLTGLAGLFVR